MDPRQVWPSNKALVQNQMRGLVLRSVLEDPTADQNQVWEEGEERERGGGG
jgi:hypothetical protein